MQKDFRYLWRRVIAKKILNFQGVKLILAEQLEDSTNRKRRVEKTWNLVRYKVEDEKGLFFAEINSLMRGKQEVVNKGRNLL